MTLRKLDLGSWNPKRRRWPSICVVPLPLPLTLRLGVTGPLVQQPLSLGLTTIRRFFQSA